MITTLTDEFLQVRVDPATPWLSLMLRPRPFPVVTVQRATVEYSATTKYSAPKLAIIGEFFYHVVPKCKSANIVAVVYVHNPIEKLIPCHVAEYAYI